MEAVKTQEQTDALDYWSRRNCIGSSDIKSIVGTCTFRGPHDVQMSKMSEEPEDVTSTYMEIGLVMEPALGELVRRKLGYHDIHVVLKPGKTYKREVDGVRFRDTPDFIAVETNRHSRPLYCVETKLGYRADRELYGEEWTDDVHAGYKDQCIWHCGMTKAPRCILAVQFSTTAFPEIYVIEADPVRFDFLQRAGIDFWKTSVVGGVVPPVDATAGCRKNLARLAQAHHTLLDVTNEQVELAKELQRIKPAIKQMTDRAKMIENGFIESIGEHLGLDFGDGVKWTYGADKNGKRRPHNGLKNLEK
tara:strand:- start:192 stop:1106 length:915 start_codon:yes stop_codon:yes gene_type:complete